MDICPCKDCERREVGCHGVCGLYNIWCTEHRKEVDRRAKESDFDSFFKKPRKRGRRKPSV